MATRIKLDALTDTDKGQVVDPASNGALSGYDYSNFYYSSSDDVFAIFDPYHEWWYGHAFGSGYSLFYQPMSTPPAGVGRGPASKSATPPRCMWVVVVSKARKVLSESGMGS